MEAKGQIKTRGWGIRKQAKDGWMKNIDGTEVSHYSDGASPSRSFSFWQVDLRKEKTVKKEYIPKKLSLFDF